MLERVTIQIPREVKDSLRKECFDRRTTYRDVISSMLFERYGHSPEGKGKKKPAKKDAADAS